MSASSRGALLLGRLLSEHAGVAVRVVWSGSAGGGWWVQWCDGPTVETMRELAATLCAARSIRCSVGFFNRSETDLARAAAVLGLLVQRPAEAPRVDSVLAAMAYDEAEHPGSGEDARRRAGALLSVCDGSILGALALLRDRSAADGGVPGVLAWLDGIAAAAADPSVADLGEARRRRAVPCGGTR